MDDYYSRKESRHAPAWPVLAWMYAAGLLLVVVGLLMQVMA